MNFANHLAERVKKNSQTNETKPLKTINATKDIEIQIGVNKQVPKPIPKKIEDSRTVEEQIKSLTSRIQKLKQNKIQNQGVVNTINHINEEITELVTNLSNKDTTPKVGLVINEKLNFKIEKLKTNKLQLQKVIKTTKVVTKAFFTTIDESMFIQDYVSPDINTPLPEPIIEILTPIKSELVNTIIYHTNIDELYGYHVLEQNNIIREAITNKKSFLVKSASVWSNWKNRMGVDKFSLKIVDKK